MAKRNFIPLVPSGTINADASVAQLEQDVLAMDSKVGELAEDIGDTEQEINQLKSQISEVESGFPQKSASGSIVTIEDGADNVPVVSLEAEINPVQDLHGYDNPWAPGAGKNLYPNSDITGEAVGVTITHNADDESYQVSGLSEAYRGFTAESSFTLEAGTYTLSRTASSDAVNVNHLRMEIRSIDGQTTYMNTGGTATCTFEEDTEVKARIVVAQGSIDFGTGITYRFQIESGSSPSAWTPYSNVCPISGWTGANINRGGENIIGKAALSWHDGEARDDSGIVGPSTSSGYSSPVPVKPSTTYALNFSTAVDSVRVYYLDDDGQFISRSPLVYSVPFTFTTPSNCGKIEIQTQMTVYKSESFAACLRVGTDGTMLPEAQTIPISWETEAGTVYGGSIKLNQDGTADLTVDHKKRTFNGTADVWWAATGYVNRFTVTDESMAASDNYSTFRSNYLKSTAWGIVLFTFGLRTDGNLYVMLDPNAEQMTVEQFNAYLSATPLEIWYELATPQTYHIENVELVKTLYLLNNIWADTGDVSLTYRADPSMYTAEQIQTMLNAMVAPVEASNVASKAYSVNDFLILNNVLYKVISPIANGGTITPNTNVSATTVGEQLTAILNS